MKSDWHKKGILFLSKLNSLICSKCLEAHSRINQEEIERDKLEGILEMFPHYLKTLSVPKEHLAYEEVRRDKRIFVLFAIDRVEVDYNRKNKWMAMVIRCNFSWEV